MDPVEREIVDRLVKDILPSGHMVSIHDGGDYGIRRSTNRHVIATTCETTLIVEATDRRNVGWIWLTHGLGCDVIADFTPSMERFAHNPEELP